jgi:hypothetical protein
MPCRAAGKNDETLTIYDIDNKFIAYAGAMSVIAEVVYEWGELLVITKDNEACHAWWF